MGGGGHRLGALEEGAPPPPAHPMSSPPRPHLQTRLQGTLTGPEGCGKAFFFALFSGALFAFLCVRQFCFCMYMLSFQRVDTTIATLERWYSVKQGWLSRSQGVLLASAVKCTLMAISTFLKAHIRKVISCPPSDQRYFQGGFLEPLVPAKRKRPLQLLPVTAPSQLLVHTQSFQTEGGPWSACSLWGRAYPSFSSSHANGCITHRGNAQ